jgi:glucose/arabinose dehydrogenase
MLEDKGVQVVRVPAHELPVEFSVVMGIGLLSCPKPPAGIPSGGDPSAARWPQEVVTKVVLSQAKDAYVVDDIPLPLDNPWRRNVRLCDVAFFKDGAAAGVTIDGDVWMIRGLGEELGEVRWKRFASGLHEPASLAIRDEQLYVFDRNGIWCATRTATAKRTFTSFSRTSSRNPPRAANSPTRSSSRPIARL